MQKALTGGGPGKPRGRRERDGHTDTERQRGLAVTESCCPGVLAHDSGLLVDTALPQLQIVTSFLL